MTTCPSKGIGTRVRMTEPARIDLINRLQHLRACMLHDPNLDYTATELAHVDFILHMLDDYAELNLPSNPGPNGLARISRS